MAAPVRIRLSRRKGWRLPAGAVNVARPGKRGNPFIVGQDGTRLQCVAMFAILAQGFIDLGGRHSVEDQMAMHARLRRAARELRGRDVACWCSLDGPCHGDIWLWLANRDRPFPLVGVDVELPRVRIGLMASEIRRLQRRKAQGAADGQA